MTRQAGLDRRTRVHSVVLWLARRFREKLGLPSLDGLEAIVRFREVDRAWVPQSIAELEISDGRVARVSRLLRVDHILRHSVVD